MSAYEKLIPIEFTEKGFSDLEGTWFRWKDKEGNYHQRSWYKDNQNFGIRPRDLENMQRVSATYLNVYRMTKAGGIDYRKLSMTFHKSQFRVKELVLAEQNLL